MALVDSSASSIGFKAAHAVGQDLPFGEAVLTADSRSSQGGGVLDTPLSSSVQDVCSMWACSAGLLLLAPKNTFSGVYTGSLIPHPPSQGLLTHAYPLQAPNHIQAAGRLALWRMEKSTSSLASIGSLYDLPAATPNPGTGSIHTPGLSPTPGATHMGQMDADYPSASQWPRSPGRVGLSPWVGQSGPSRQGFPVRRPGPAPPGRLDRLKWRIPGPTAPGAPANPRRGRPSATGPLGTHPGRADPPKWAQPPPLPAPLKPPSSPPQAPSAVHRPGGQLARTPDGLPGCPASVVEKARIDAWPMARTPDGRLSPSMFKAAPRGNIAPSLASRMASHSRASGANVICMLNIQPVLSSCGLGHATPSGLSPPSEQTDPLPLLSPLHSSLPESASAAELDDRGSPLPLLSPLHSSLPESACAAELDDRGSPMLMSPTSSAAGTCMQMGTPTPSPMTSLSKETQPTFSPPESCMPMGTPTPAPSPAPSLSQGMQPSPAGSCMQMGTPTPAPSPAPSLSQGMQPSPAGSCMQMGTPTPAPSPAPSLSQGMQPSPAGSCMQMGTPTPAPSPAPSLSQGMQPSPAGSCMQMGTPTPTPSPMPSFSQGMQPTFSPAGSCMQMGTPTLTPSPLPSRSQGIQSSDAGAHSTRSVSPQPLNSTTATRGQPQAHAQWAVTGLSQSCGNCVSLHLKTSNQALAASSLSRTGHQVHGEEPGQHATTTIRVRIPLCTSNPLPASALVALKAILPQADYLSLQQQFYAHPDSCSGKVEHEWDILSSILLAWMGVPSSAGTASMAVHTQGAPDPGASAGQGQGQGQATSVDPLSCSLLTALDAAAAPKPPLLSTAAQSDPSSFPTPKLQPPAPGGATSTQTLAQQPGKPKCQGGGGGDGGVGGKQQSTAADPWEGMMRSQTHASMHASGRYPWLKSTKPASLSSTRPACLSGSRVIETGMASAEAPRFLPGSCRICHIGQTLRPKQLPSLVEAHPLCVDRTRQIIKLFRILARCSKSLGALSATSQGPTHKERYKSLVIEASRDLVVAMVKQGWTCADVETLPLGVGLPLKEAFQRVRAEPPSGWPVEAYALVGREDIAATLAATMLGHKGAAVADAAAASNSDARTGFIS
eukprot:gene19895-26598_t